MINIKKSHRGLLTRQAKQAGMTLAQFSNKVKVPGSHYSDATKKRVQFRLNSLKWNHNK